MDIERLSRFVTIESLLAKKTFAQKTKEAVVETLDIIAHLSSFILFMFIAHSHVRMTSSS
jgi:hypothetical protein